MEFERICIGFGVAVSIALMMYMVQDPKQSDTYLPIPVVVRHQHKPSIMLKSIMCPSTMRGYTSKHETDSFKITPEPTAIDGVYFLGCLRTDQNYSIFSVSIDNSRTGPDYLFYTPLTTLAWKRIGFYSVVVMSLIMDDSGDWAKDPLLQLVVRNTLENESFILFLRTDYDHTIKVLFLWLLSSTVTISFICLTQAPVNAVSFF